MAKKNFLLLITILFISEKHAFSQAPDDVYKFDNVQMEDFKNKALNATKELSTYIQTIGNKSNPNIIRDKAIQQAVSLFVNDTVKVEVSSTSSGKIRTLTIRQYLTKIKALPYQQVKITFYNIVFASDFKKMQDESGRYEAIVTIFQKFEGKLSEDFTYRDVTKKNIQIIITPLLDQVTNETKWQVFLGDIKVTETKKG